MLVYYAGHGIQVDGENYLIPIDAKFEAEADLPDQGVKLAEIMAALEAATSKMRIVILDACRNNPFGGTSSGLAIVDAPAGSIVAYSTAPGTEAFDGNGKHSPYAAAFMRTAKHPESADRAGLQEGPRARQRGHRHQADPVGKLLADRRFRVLLERERQQRRAGSRRAAGPRDGRRTRLASGADRL